MLTCNSRSTKIQILYIAETFKCIATGANEKGELKMMITIRYFCHPADRMEMKDLNIFSY